MALSSAPMGTPESPNTVTRHTVELHVGRTLGILLTVLASAAVLYLTWLVLARFSHLLLTLVLSMLVAFIFAPAVSSLQRRGLPRVLAIAAAYVGSIAVIAGVLTLFLGPLIAQLAALAGDWSHQTTALQGPFSKLDEFFISHRLPVRMAAVQKQVLDQAQTIGGVVLSSTLVILTSLTSFVVDLFLILVLSFYLLLDSNKIHNNLIRLLPERLRSQAFFVEAAFFKVVGGYIRGQLLMAVTIGVAAGLGCAILGVPYPLVIGLLAGLFELMPMVGPVLGAIPALLISLTQGFPLVLWVVLLFLLIQQVESNVIGPRITGHAVGLHPLGAMLALLAGVEMGGLIGALFAVPVAGILYVLAVAVYWQWQGRTLPDAPRTQSRMIDLARGVVRRRQTAPASPLTTPSSPIIKAAAGVAAAGGEAAPRPEALATLDREADHLRERFEQSESERQTEQVTPAP